MKLTVVVQEDDSPFPPRNPEPLIYFVEVEDKADDAAILDLIAQQRCDDLGQDDLFETDPAMFTELRDGLSLCFAFEGKQTPAVDWRG